MSMNRSVDSPVGRVSWRTSRTSERFELYTVTATSVWSVSVVVTYPLGDTTGPMPVTCTGGCIFGLRESGAVNERRGKQQRRKSRGAGEFQLFGVSHGRSPMKI